jgi:steroid 5-alpha reductase family enzyme
MDRLYLSAVYLLFSFSLVVLFLLFYISAPYGKFLRKGWGPTVGSKWAWMLMELPSPALLIILFVLSSGANIVTWVFLLLWLSHYIYRTFIYSFRQSGRNKPYPLILVGMAFIFNCLNGFANGYGVFHLKFYSAGWFYSWQFLLGIAIFITGFIINKTADEKLRNLRKDNPEEYVIPHGWLFDYISCPHYFGEILEWTGWAILTWSVAGAAFAVFTFANLFPRALSSHKWYKEKFPEYPKDRKAVFPFIV